MRQNTNHRFTLRWSLTAALLGFLCAASTAPSAEVKLARPTPEQAAWQDLELGMFIHYDMPVFKPGWDHRQYENRPDASSFNPRKLDTDQWMEAAQAMGAKYAVLVAKHGSGFMCWQSDLYPYGMKQSPYRNGQGDIVRDFVHSCQKYGIRPGIYAHMGCNGYLEVDNPGLVNRGKGGDPEKQTRYAKICEGMLTELWGNYGNLMEIWFDGGVLDPAKGGPDMLPILRRLQPNAIVFQGPAATIRWIGNEDGVAPYPCWATVPEVRDYNGAGDPNGPKWLPGECDVPIRQGIWMWEPNTESRLYSVDQLMDRYYRSVGRNCNLLLNANPDADGLIPASDVKRYRELGDEIRRRFGASIGETNGNGKVVELALARPARIDQVVTMENILEGERVREYVLEGEAAGQWKELCRGASIGHKKIDRFSPVEVSRIRWRCLQSIAEPRLRRLAAYGDARVNDGASADGTPARNAAAPRIVNIYNFARNSDSRLPDSEQVLFEATRRQIQLIKEANLPATWALQYDALINPRYQTLLQGQLGTNDEIAAWWEIPRPLAEKAGLKWRGRFDWDWAANVGFSPGYTPEERRKLVDVYMTDFKAIFGYYPRTVGSWFIDEVTLAYLAERYGIVASCNCKDQVGTDGYTLWGGYWNQAYYPSRRNAYMPAQTKAEQIDVPIFRMLGSDPIYQHGTTPGMFTLEPVYPQAGGSADWVAWFMKNLIHQPALAFGYAQAGQENSFGWEAMKTGLTLQIALLAKQVKAGEIRVETLAQSGQWFRRHFPLTPPTAVVCLDDWKHQDRKTVWYDSRFYRLNVLWEDGGFFIRDLHLFDENLVSVTHDTALTETSLEYGTLPVMDGARWSGTEKAGIWPVLISSNGETTPMAADGPPAVKELSATTLSINQPLRGGGGFSMVCGETEVACAGIDSQGQPLNWAWNMVGGPQQKSAVQRVAPNSVGYHVSGMDYQLRLAPGGGSCRLLDNGTIRLSPNTSGKLDLLLERRPAPGQ